MDKFQMLSKDRIEESEILTETSLFRDYVLNIIINMPFSIFRLKICITTISSIILWQRNPSNTFCLLIHWKVTKESYFTYIPWTPLYSTDAEICKGHSIRFQMCICTIVSGYITAAWSILLLVNRCVLYLNSAYISADLSVTFVTARMLEDSPWKVFCTNNGFCCRIISLLMPVARHGALKYELCGQTATKTSQVFDLYHIHDLWFLYHWMHNS